MRSTSYHHGCSWLLVALISITFTTGSYVAHPAIDLEQLGQIGIAGPYGGISLYTDSQQLTQIPTSTASVLTYTNETFQLLSSSSTNGSIYTSCMMPSNQLYVGGDFVQFGSVNVSNIAMIDLNTGSVSALAEGLDGPVYTLYCDTKQQRVYAGGNFLAPVASSPQYAESLAYFGGSVAVWQNGAWIGLPWKGLNGPVNVITQNNKTGSVLFGGQFDTSADGQTNYAPASQPISLSSPAVISAQNSGTINNDPSSIICPSELDSDPWLLLDDTAGYWEAIFPYSVTPSLIRFANTHMDGRGTQNFSVIALPSNTAFNFTYIDPVTRRRRSCSTNCSLSSDTSIEYQDFVIEDATLASGIRVEISSWYGLGGGLASIEIFQREIFVYAVQSLNGATCGSDTNQAQVKTTGSWKSSQVSDSYQYILSTTIEASKLGSSTASIEFIPNLPESGVYEVYFYSPKCTTDCAQRTQVDITVYPVDGNSTVTTVDLSNNQTSSTLVYSGPIQATSDSFQPYVSLGVAHNATKPKSGNAVIAAQAVQFVKIASNTTLTSLLEFTPDQTSSSSTSTGSNGTLTGAYGPLADNVPYMSTVNALDASDGNIYIGGNFSYTSTNKTYQNIVLFDSAKNQLVPLTNNGLNGPVNALYRKNADLYIGGSFQSVASGAKMVLNNVARYNTNNGGWHALAGGVNGFVEAFYQSPPDGSAIVASGNHTGFYSDEKVTKANATSGNAWWNTTSNAWSVDGPYISGSVFGSYNLENGTTVVVGNIKAAQRYQARGFSFVNSNVTLASFPVYPDASQSFVINAGAFWNDEKNGNATVTILGGQFELQDGIQNVALYENGVWTAVSKDWQGLVNTMVVSSGYLYIGGSFTVAKDANSSSIAIYDLVNRTFVPVPDLHTEDGTIARVNKIITNPTNGNVVVGGNFSTAGSLSCEGICVLDPNSHQWNNLGGSGIGGEVLDFTFTGDKLIVAGNLTLGGTSVPIVQYNYNSNDWNTFAPMMSDAGLPGASTAVSYDSKTQKTFIAGQVNSSAYIRVWDGQQFSTPDVELGPGSSIKQITVLPLKQGETGVNLEGSTESVLLVIGLLNLDGYGNVSSAFYNGSQWIPYFVSSAANGTAGAVGSVFFQSYFPALTVTTFLPAPLVVLVSIAAALGIVFLIVFCAFGILFAKRRREAKVDPAANPATYYGKPPRRPESLLAMLDAAATAGTLSYEAKKLHFDNEPPAAAAADAEYQSFADTKREMTENTKTPGAALGGFTAATAATAAATTAVTAASNASRDVKEQQPSSLAGENVYNYNNNAPTRNSYNPFRASAVGLAVSDDNSSSIIQGGITSSYASRSPAVTPSTATVAAGAAATGVTSAAGLHDNLYANIDQAEPQPSSTVRWTTAPAAEMGTATVGNSVSSCSFLAVPATAGVNRSSTSSETEQAANTVRWTNTGANSAAAMGTAMVMPVAGAMDRESAVNPQAAAGAATAGNTLSKPTFNEEGVPPSSTVRWTNYTAHSAQGVATVRPVTMTSMYSDVTSMLDQSDVFGNIRPSMVDDFSSDPDIVRWTTAPNADNAKATAAIVAGMEAAQRSSVASTSSQATMKQNYSPNGSRASSRQYSSNLDLSSFTLTENNEKYTCITPSERSLANDTSIKQTSSSFTLAENNDNKHAGIANERFLSNDDGTKQVSSSFSVTEDYDKYAGITTNERSLSHDGTTQVPINILAADVQERTDEQTRQQDRTMKKKDEEKVEDRKQVAAVQKEKKAEPSSSEPSFMDHDLFKTSSFRWSDGPAPLNTNFDIKIQEASPATSPEKPSALQVTNTIAEPTSKAMFTTSFDDLYEVANDFGVSSTNTGSSAIDGTTTHATATTAADINDVRAGATTVGAAAAISASDSNKTASNSNNAANANNHSALDGRAASKRMVQDFLSSREQVPAASAKETSGEKKYHKDFLAAMEAAARNNADDLPCTEDHPNLYYAKFDFNAREHGELGFDKGDPIIVVDRSDDIWWMGYKDNGDQGPMQGVFPSNYVERAPAASNLR